MPIFCDEVNVCLPVNSLIRNGSPNDVSEFKFGAGVARDGCALWQNAGVVAPPCGWSL